MNTTRTSPIARIVAAAAAVVITFTVFSGVTSVSEPQRSQLAALNKHREASQQLALAQGAVQHRMVASK
ncbi:hypothetical protein HLB44_33000 [Aquincola sp. S2]|uniref:Uncharacterized protein n=1 Tax=Pseudaquabacterium terrae TaxID=2732868 RepID=A0ABX2ETJ0_9BURK|nr:hypothetical protein [Aquabacterium terrae]NRF71815.1 hypothetical protein [Aquabacterium terrae]